MFEIIKNAELPRQKQGIPKYPFAQMEVGDGFDAPRDMGARGDKDARQSSIASSSRLWAKRNNPAARFSVRLIDENTVRCVRIA